jgi:hypothetical protein
MLSSDQQADLAAAICATAETLGQTVSASAAELMAEDLADYPPHDVGNALRACRRELTGRLTLAAIIDRTNAADGRPDRDEAWSIALAGADEFDTVVMTEEIRKAMTASAPILRLGDKVGARMAFISAYDRHVSEARKAGEEANWTVSLGFDADRRKIAVEGAVRSGLLSAPQAEREIQRLGLDAPQVTPGGQAIAGLITGKVGKPRQQDREKLAKIKRNMLAQSRINRENKAAALRQQLKDREQERDDQLAALDNLRSIVGGEV